MNSSEFEDVGVVGRSPVIEALFRFLWIFKPFVIGYRKLIGPFLSRSSFWRDGDQFFIFVLSLLSR